MFFIGDERTSDPLLIKLDYFYTSQVTMALTCCSTDFNHNPLGVLVGVQVDAEVGGCQSFKIKDDS